MAPPEVVAGTSAEDEGSKKVKKKIKKKENLCGFKTRFNSKWLGDLAEQLSPAKQSIIRNGPFGDLLDIKPFKVPHALIEFVVMNTNHALREFKYKNKSIKFSKDMVKRIFNVPSGDSPVKLLKKSDEHDLRSIYKDGNRAPIAHVFKLLKDCSDTDESMIKRTWALVALAIVVCPGTGNMVNLEYLASLENMDLVQNLAWDEHVLARAMEEVSVFQEKKRAQATIENPKEFQIRSCLPMLAIIYMDHLDIPPGLPNEHIIDYSVPRIRYVCQKDFDWVDRVDKNKLTLVQPFYGKHTQFRSLCNTPYAPLLIGPGVDPEAATGQGVGAEAANGRGSQNEAPEAQANVEVQPNLSSSFDDWLQQPFPSMDDLKVPAKFQSLYDKHKEIFSTEVDDALGKFGQSLKGLQSNRMAAMLRDMGDAIANTMDDARDKENDAQHEAQAAEPTVDDAREKEDAQHEAQAAEPTVDEAREKEKAAQHEAQAAKPTVVDVHEKEKDAQHEAQAAEPTVDEAREKEKDARHEAQAATPTMDEAREKKKDAQAATTGTGDEAEGAAADIVLNKDQVIGEQEKNQEVATVVGHTHEQQRVSMEVEGDVPPQSPPLFFDAPRSATAGVWDDEPSFELFPKGSEDYELMHGMDEHTNRNKTCTPLYTNIPVFPVSDDDGSPTIPADMMVAVDEHPIDVSSGPSTHDKNTRKKRMAKVPAVKTKGKKQKVEVKEDKVAALYEKYIKHGKPLRRSKPNELLTPFIKIGGFYVGYKKFLACLKPRGEMNDEIMSLCIEQLNLASYGTNNRDVKKYFFSVHGASLLKQDPSVFQPNALMAELERAVIKFKVQKYDLLWFAIVHERHWVVVCVNLLHKQWNVFDSVNAKGKPSPLKKQSNNLITNFTTLAQESDAFNVHVASFTRADLDDYPKQNNLCDCGFFGLKYVENFDGKALKDFEQGDITRYRMDWAYNLCNHPLNKGSMELAFREELAE